MLRLFAFYRPRKVNIIILIDREVKVSKVALISTNRRQLKIYRQLHWLIYKASRNVFSVSEVNLNNFYFYNNNNRVTRTICHRAAFRWCLPGFLEMQLYNTGPLTCSSACVRCPRISQVRNKNAKWVLVVLDSKGYACLDTDLVEFLFHYVMFFHKENRYLSSKIYGVFFDEISYDLLDHYAYLCPS